MIGVLVDFSEEEGLRETVFFGYVNSRRMRIFDVYDGNEDVVDRLGDTVSS